MAYNSEADYNVLNLYSARTFHSAISIRCSVRVYEYSIKVSVCLYTSAWNVTCPVSMYYRYWGTIQNLFRRSSIQHTSSNQHHVIFRLLHTALQTVLWVYLCQLEYSIKLRWSLRDNKNNGKQIYCISNVDSKTKAVESRWAKTSKGLQKNSLLLEQNMIVIQQILSRSCISIGLSL